jgi:uncharacterized protein (TIGR02001 family)
MNKAMSLMFGVALMGSALAASAADIAGNVTLATDYRFRGISQNAGNFSPAIQGGFDWSHESGFYVGTWASNVNFDAIGPSGQPGGSLGGGAIETDVYGGFKGKINDDYAYDIGLYYYGYPQDGSAHLGYTEAYTSVSAYGAKVGVNYSWNYFAGSDPFWYWYGNYGIEVVKNVNVNAHWGYNHFETRQSYTGNNDGGGPINNQSYADWSLGVSTAYLGVTWALTYVDTNISKNACFGPGNGDLCQATAVFSISKSL